MRSCIYFNNIIILQQNKNENVHRFALRGELLEKEGERERERDSNK